MEGRITESAHVRARPAARPVGRVGRTQAPPRLKYLRTQVPVPEPAAPPARMATSVVAKSRPSAVVVGDMLVAEDSDSDVIEEFDDGDDSDDKPKVIKVISRSRPSLNEGHAVSKASLPEPSWHALLRRTASSRTASIARSLPRTPTRPSVQQQQQHQQPAHPGHGTVSKIIRTHGSQRPVVNVPAKVLVPRSRLILTSRLLPAGAHVRLPLGALGGGVVLGGVAGKTPDKTGLPVRRDQQIVAGARGHGLTGRIVVSAVGPLSPAESAVLDGVVDMELEWEARWASIWAYMRAYGVRGSDTFPDFFE